MNIIVIGDIILDINYNVTFIKKAPEANIPVYKSTNIDYKLGGASNVANNLSNITNNNVELISIIGDDYYGSIIKQLLDKNIKNKLFIDKRQTTQKNRLFENNNLITRFDIEDTHDISNNLENQIIDYITSKTQINAIILSDYDKGLLTINLCQSIIKFCNEHNIFTFVDPKLKNILKYKNCFCLKPNMNEATVLTNETNIDNIFNTLFNKLNAKNIVITNAEHGIYLNNSNTIINHKKKFNVVDVTGAGDVFMSVLTLYYLQCNDLLLSSKVANYIASKSINCIGNYKIKETDISEYFLNENIVIYENETNKIKLLKEINNNIIFTNGCFDIFHSAHLRLLNFCKEHNGTFILGLNSDISITKIKGLNRPINNLNERLELLKNLNFIDHIIVYDSETPYNILQYLKPNIIVKGGDYNINNIIGNEFCEEIKLFNFINGISTTNIIKKVFDKQP